MVRRFHPEPSSNMHFSASPPRAMFHVEHTLVGNLRLVGRYAPKYEVNLLIRTPPGRSTWNTRKVGLPQQGWRGVDLDFSSRRSNGRERTEHFHGARALRLRTVVVVMFQVVAPTPSTFLVPTSKYRRSDCGTGIGSRHSQSVPRRAWSRSRPPIHRITCLAATRSEAAQVRKGSNSPTAREHTKSNGVISSPSSS